MEDFSNFWDFLPFENRIQISVVLDNLLRLGCCQTIFWTFSSLHFQVKNDSLTEFSTFQNYLKMFKCLNLVLQILWPLSKATSAKIVWGPNQWCALAKIQGDLGRFAQLSCKQHITTSLLVCTRASTQILRKLVKTCINNKIHIQEFLLPLIVMTR